MAIRLNWERVRNVHTELQDKGFQDGTPITFLLRLRSGEIRKSDVLFKNFLRFFWALTDNPEAWIESLIVQDEHGKTIYRYNQGSDTHCHEVIPQGGNPDIILNWNALTPVEKDIYLRLMIAQINANG